MAKSPFTSRFEQSALAACEEQFPRNCNACKRRFASFGAFVQLTQKIGLPRADEDDDEDGAIGALSFANCSCGGTMAVRYESLAGHRQFNMALRAEGAESRRAEGEVLLELVLAVDELALASSVARTAPAPNSLILDAGAALAAIVARGKTVIPPYPAVAFKVEQMARSPNTSAAQLTEVLAGDPALAAAVLQLANSAMFSRGQPVTSLAVAVGRIGMAEIARVAVTAGVGATAGQAGALAPLRARLWNRSLTTAHLSRALARHRGIAVDEAFLCGLLQPLGSMVGSLCIDVFLRETPNFPAQPLSFWLRLVEMFRAEIGGLTATRWKLPVLFCDVLGGAPPDRSKLANAALFDVADVAAEAAVIAEGRGALHTEDLLTIPGLRDDAERQFLVAAHAASAESISSFEQAVAQPPMSSASRVSAGPEPISQPCAEVWVVNRKTSARYRVVGVAVDEVILEGATPLPVSQLARLDVETTPELSFFATTRSCEGVAGSKNVRIVSLPFGLAAEAKSRWQRLLLPELPA